MTVFNHIFIFIEAQMAITVEEVVKITVLTDVEVFKYILLYLTDLNCEEKSKFLL